MDNGSLVFGSVCSGIEAASVAWESLGWKAAWFSEIEPFPCAVLAHHYPGVQNLGDMTAIAPRILAGEICAPDIFCGGTPCQAFSVAGLRRSLDDARGNLTLTFCDIADAIDSARTVRGQHPAVIFWENVPGVLNTKDNAFGCFLGALSGEGCELQPAGGKWTNAGCVFGPQRTVAWRILDAQYFGVAQRRRRVFVVASARKGFDPTAVLFEFDGVRRDTAPRRETRQGAPAIPPRSTAGGGLGTDFDSGGVIPELAKCLTTGTGLRYDTDTDTILPVAFAENSRHEIRLEGSDGQRAGALSTGGGKPGQGVPMIAFHPTQDPISSTDGVTHCRGTGGGQGNATIAVAVQSSQSGVRINATVGTLDANYGSRRHNGVMQAMQVRRLTPTECERLQGFPDGYTAIPWRKKPASECPDSPRYKALGNSWAVPVVRWIGRRILKELSNA